MNCLAGFVEHLSREFLTFAVVGPNMSELAGHNSAPIVRQQLVGPPMLAKVGAAISLLVAIVSVATLDPVVLGMGVLALLAAYKLSRLGLVIEGGELVVRNAFYTKRLNLETSFLHQGKADMRVREASGIDELPPSFIPRLEDDNTRYDAKVIKVTDTSTKETYVVDASFGLTPPKQANLFESLEASVGAAKELPGSTS